MKCSPSLAECTGHHKPLVSILHLYLYVCQCHEVNKDGINITYVHVDVIMLEVFVCGGRGEKRRGERGGGRERRRKFGWLSRKWLQLSVSLH